MIPSHWIHQSSNQLKNYNIFTLKIRFLLKDGPVETIIVN